MFWRALSDNTSALVFFSRRTDMPYRYKTSLSKLNYTSGYYKVCFGPGMGNASPGGPDSSRVFCLTGRECFHLGFPLPWVNLSFCLEGHKTRLEYRLRVARPCFRPSVVSLPAPKLAENESLGPLVLVNQLVHLMIRILSSSTTVFSPRSLTSSLRREAP